MSHGKLLLACMPSATPLVAAHPHDCDHCVFLGQAEQADEVTRDIYVCPKSERVPHDELILRYGRHGDYSSLPATVADKMTSSMLWFMASVAYTGWQQGRYGPR